VGWSRIAITTTDANAGNPLASALGIPGSNVPGDPLTDGLPLITIAGSTTLGSAGNLPAIIVTNNYQLDDNVSISKGKHTLQIGGQFQRLEYNLFQVSNLRGSMAFTTAYSSDPAHLAGTGIGLADLLLGAPVSGSLQYLDGTRGFRQSQLAFFVQDDYKLTDKITLNLGLRYENYLGWPWQEVDRRAYAFNPANGGTVAQVGTDGIPTSGVKDNALNFMPRVGVAYRFLPKTVFRAAYGIFYSAPQLPLAVNPSGNPPDIVSTAFTNNQYNYGAASLISDGFHHPAVGSPLGSALTYIPLNTPLPQTQQWNASIQHQLTQSTIITIAYAGTSGTHLEVSNNLNQPIPGNTSIVSRRPFPLYTTINEVEDTASSKYNGLQVSAERRFSGGLTFQISYSYSHALDYISQNPGSGGATFLDTYNHKYDYGNSDFNIPQRFIASWNYLLPFQHNGPLHWLVNGWQVNGILSLYDGLPFTVLSATNTLNNGATSHAQYVGSSNGALPSGQQSVKEWFDVAAFTTPGTLQWGDVGRNTLSGPPTRQLDASLFKNFKIGEGSKNLQFRTEVFNVFNTPQFNNPAATIGAAGVGTITSAGSPYTLQRLSREIQLAMKFSF
jgi:outer membrane receptor protein involved in Fe transport